jgi:hypothetical protein
MSGKRYRTTALGPEDAEDYDSTVTEAQTPIFPPVHAYNPDGMTKYLMDYHRMWDVLKPKPGGRLSTKDIRAEIAAWASLRDAHTLDAVQWFETAHKRKRPRKLRVRPYIEVIAVDTVNDPASTIGDALPYLEATESDGVDTHDSTATASKPLHSQAFTAFMMSAMQRGSTPKGGYVVIR